MGLCRNAVGHKLRSGLEDGKHPSNRIVERDKRVTLLYGSNSSFSRCILNANLLYKRSEFGRKTVFSPV